MIHIQLPLSKSIGARFLVATYFAGTLPADPYFEDNEDLKVIQNALLHIYSDEEPIDYGETPVDLHSSGTAMRFVTAVCASTSGADYVITGAPRLCLRPMKPLLDVLREAGAEIYPAGKDETGPYRVVGRKLQGGEFAIEGNISSQFISALMLCAPTWENGMKLKFTTPIVSLPYIEMTAEVMHRFGISVDLKDGSVEIPSSKYIDPRNFKNETDWSAASFFYEACSITGNEFHLDNLTPPQNSLQGDAICAHIFEKLGVISNFSKSGVTIIKKNNSSIKIIEDFHDYPDLVLPVAVSSFLNNVQFHFSGVAHLRLKESDRIAAITKEAKKLGYLLETGDDYVSWNGDICPSEKFPLIETYDDHRVAMAFAMAVLKRGEIRISNPDVVEKSFAKFWDEIPKLGISIKREGNVMTLNYNSRV